MARGLEMIVGSVNDPVFGPYVMVGAGGVFSEIIRDTTLRFAPFGVREALDMLDELKIARVLRGYRGARPYDIDALADALVRVSELVADHAATIAELDINPLFVRHAGEAVIAADGLAGLKPVAQR
ncbi:MAG: hypothetical protein A3G24_07370 [Betaproteobacteria bacterium RIFCSPLOWO2_12_FULL_62_13]|nr:MAG: hypothetical protein A3G24_07370 [Betaproteobacteria bacterium RIFCSPLOWO2_12_FULL_62_13]